MSFEPEKNALPRSALDSGLKSAAARIVKLAEEAARLGQVEVDDIIKCRSQDLARIERQLDLLLDVAFHPDGLKQFKRLCRYSFSFAPVSVAGYIDAYREMWDTPDDLEEGPDVGGAAV
jgi:hypothetical protein